MEMLKFLVALGVLTSVAVPDRCAPPASTDWPQEILNSWPAEIHLCNWVAQGHRSTVYFMEILWTLTNTSDQRWDRFDIAYRVHVGGDVVAEKAPSDTTYFEPPKPGETKEYYTGDGFPVFVYRESESLVDALEARRSGTAIPYYWYGMDDNRVDEPDLSSMRCEVEYDNLRNN